jgi:adenylate kinase family enzyme
VPLFTPREALPSRPRRVLVAGTSGAGKTTLAAQISEVLAIPHIEIDALYHGPNWTPRETFEEEVLRFSSEPSWVTEWQYGPVRALLRDRADLLVWLDLPRLTVMRQIALRTLRRRLLREVLWNGNVEPPLRTFLHDREHIVRWAWSTHHKTRVRVAELLQRDPGLPVVHLRSRQEAAIWLNGPLTTAATGR